ncbi:hypothetical protein [Oceanihabitans sediminis]|uniref:Glycerophosphoryl diester phosphodiesterase membrane domain-containing protein n=1 Tax=Oceanihabitans sediminis TaxID=1812012 RepID=A0A368P637_9FLAO|nr:hypothetical protein [Oceanihabitans sediminis]MDX1277412.1 hypothetical protein [Oceanihabitans sediminis]MDX1774209.1 hypothetical protein [Oceanihabitans sediminis]RBP30781.1 hypothetical protein DFR65_10438 [Oceanihabitans sediminis]RCU56751.1 hypothetical protein DU428_10355 [Oceanihabitans sediminis]
MKKYIELKKQRELGEVLTDTFGFIREEFKPFVKTIFQVTGIYLVLFLISVAFYIYSAGGIFDFQSNNDFNADNLPLMVGSFFLFMIFGLLTYTLADAAVLHYIKSYSENKGVVNLEEVKKNAKDSFWGFLGLSILKFLTLFVAVMLCVIPVFYAMVPMFVVLAIYVFKGKDTGESYSYSFKLIKNEYWITLATIIVFGLIIMVASYALSVPTAIYSLIKTGVFSGEVDPTNMKMFVDPIYIFLNVLNYLFKFLLNLILTVASVFVYFNLNEKQNFTGTFERIESLGKIE